MGWLGFCYTRAQTEHNSDCNADFGMKAILPAVPAMPCDTARYPNCKSGLCHTDPIPDPSKQNCSHNHKAGGSHACRNSNYPICLGHISGHRWGKCHTAAQTNDKVCNSDLGTERVLSCKTTQFPACRNSLCRSNANSLQTNFEVCNSGRGNNDELCTVGDSSGMHARVSSIPVSDAASGVKRGVSFVAHAPKLPVLKADSTSPSFEDKDFDRVDGFDFFSTSDPAKMRQKLAATMKERAQKEVLKKTKIEGTQFAEYAPHVKSNRRLEGADAKGFAHIMNPTRISVPGTSSTTFYREWTECSDSQDKHKTNIAKAWKDGKKAVEFAVKMWIIEEYKPEVEVSDGVLDKSHSLLWTVESSRYSCTEFRTSLSLQAKDAGGHISDPLKLTVTIPYGVPVIHADSEWATNAATTCGDEPIDEQSLQRYGLGIPYILENQKCPSPFLDLDYRDIQVNDGLQCTTAYASFERNWVLTRKDPKNWSPSKAWEGTADTICPLPAALQDVRYTQYVTMGGRPDYEMPEGLFLQFSDATEDELDEIFSSAIESGQARFQPATPLLILKDTVLELPNEKDATLVVKPEDFYLGDSEPVSECGLCDVTANPVVVDRETPFSCLDIGSEQVVTVIAINNIGISTEKSAKATIVDIHPPVFKCPDDASVPCDQVSNTVKTGELLELWDNCASASEIEVSYSDSIVLKDSESCEVTLSRTWTAIDANGNSASCTQTVTGESAPDDESKG